jgi:hypothetical protein
MNRAGEKGNSQTAVDRITAPVANPSARPYVGAEFVAGGKIPAGEGLAGARVREA